MSLRIRLNAATLSTATLVAAIAIMQLRKADAENQQPATKTAEDVTQPTPNTAAIDSVYLEFSAPTPSKQSAEQKVRDALEKPITVEFKETALKDAVNFIAKLCGINATLNINALNEEGIADDEPITLTRKQPASAAAVLKTVLEPLNLTFIVKDENLTITTEIDAEESLDQRLYDVEGLAKTGISTKSIVKLIEQETSGPWYDIDGVGGTIDRFDHLLAIDSTERVHAETKLLLEVLERIATGNEKTGVASLHMIPPDRKVFAALSQQVIGEFQQTPLPDVAAYLGKLTRTDILIDAAALAEEGIDGKEPITAQFKQINLKSALKLILEPHDMTYIIEDGVLKITTALVAEETMDTFIFNIRDFHEAGYDCEKLIESLRTATSGPWMEIDGTGGTFNDLLPGLLIVRQTWRVLDECIEHLENLRTILKQSSPTGQLPKSTRDPNTAGLILKQYTITNLPIEDVHSALPKFVATDSWKSAGGRGELAIIESKIIVRQTREVHREIDDFLEKIGERFGIGGIGTGLSGTVSPLPGAGFFHVK